MGFSRCQTFPIEPRQGRSHGLKRLCDSSRLEEFVDERRAQRVRVGEQYFLLVREVPEDQTSMPYGYREYGARDPEGGPWSFMRPTQ